MPMSKKEIKRIAIMLYRLKFGGAEKVMLMLAGELANRGIKVDVVACEAEGEFSGAVPDSVEVVDLAKLGAFDASKRLMKYFESKRPDAVIANGDRCTMVAYLARKKTRHQPLIATVVHHDLVGATAVASGKERIFASIKKIPMAYIYPKVDRVIAVSQGVADSVNQFLRFPRERIRIIYNPIEPEKIQEEAKDKVSHPWFAEDRKVPVIISVGRLTQQKDYSTLLRAYAKLSEKMPAHLAIIGEGLGREKIEDTIEELGIGENVMLFGYQRNPHKYVARSDLFALSSIFEGFGMVIAEALAVGTPVVSTDCPSGPAELLGTKSGLLAPVGDPDALAEVMMEQLKSGAPAHAMPSYLKNTADTADRYLQVLRGDDL